MSQGSEQASPAKDAFTWQQSRRRADGQFNCPVQGFTEGGGFTLWVPTPVAFRRYTFTADGEPMIEIAGSCLNDDPELQELRAGVIRSLASAGAGLMTVDLAFLKYCAAVLRRNYNLTPEDLTMLLAGTKWHDAMLRHLIGGDGFVDAVLVHGPSLVPQLAPPPPLPSLPRFYEDRTQATDPRGPQSSSPRRWWQFWH